MSRLTAVVALVVGAPLALVSVTVVLWPLGAVVGAVAAGTGVAVLYQGEVS